MEFAAIQRAIFNVADDGNHVIRKIDGAGNVTTYAGTGTYGSVDGPAAQAQFKELQGLAMDAAGNLFAGSLGVIRKVDPQGNVTTFATLPEAGRVTVAFTPDGRLFATDSSQKLYQVATNGTVSVFAGSVTGASDGNRTVALFQLNRAVAADALGIVYLCDGNNVRKIFPDGTVDTMVQSVTGGGSRIYPVRVGWRSATVVMHSSRTPVIIASGWPIHSTGTAMELPIPAKEGARRMSSASTIAWWTPTATAYPTRRNISRGRILAMAVRVLPFRAWRLVPPVRW